jgi:hypothetical protein
MKKYMIYLILIIPVVFTSCMSAKSYFKKGYYDMAIQKSSQKLMKNPQKEKHIQILHKSYNIANQKDIDRISFLRSSGQPEIWEEVFELYSRMKRRQDMVKFLAPSILQRINFQNINYDNEIHAAKLNAAEYFYASGMKLLNENNREAARLAYYDFLKVKKYYDEFRDVDKLIRDAEERGTVNVLFQVKNSSNMIMPQGFEYELTQLSLADMNILFRRFFNRSSNDLHFHYFVTMYINQIYMSPEQVKEVHYSETREIQDGFQYVLDQNGNVMKDSLGNDIKVPKYVSVTCNVVEVQQFKSVAVTSSIAIVREDNQPLIQEPLTGEWVFDNRFITVSGDQRAMSEETRQKLGWKALPFPSSEFMILQTTDILKNMSKDFVYKHRNLFN